MVLVEMEFHMEDNCSKVDVAGMDMAPVDRQEVRLLNILTQNLVNLLLMVRLVRKIFLARVAVVDGENVEVPFDSGDDALSIPLPSVNFHHLIVAYARNTIWDGIYTYF